MDFLKFQKNLTFMIQAEPLEVQKNRKFPNLAKPLKVRNNLDRSRIKARSQKA